MEKAQAFGAAVLHDRIVLGNAIQVGAPGEPVLPMVPCRIVIPHGQTVDEIEVMPGQEYVLEGTHRIVHGETPMPLISGVVPRATEPDAAIYESDDVFPGQRYKICGVQSKRGVDTLFIQLNPVVYRPLSGSVSWYRDMTVRVRTRPSSASAMAGRTIKYRPDPILPVEAMSDNPAVVETYLVEHDAAVMSKPPEMSSQEEWPTLPCQSGDFEYVIVTSTNFRDAATDVTVTNLLAYHREQGRTATIAVMEDILSAYTGVDDAERLRNFITDAYDDAKWSTDYVLLAGDIDVVPMRRLWGAVGGQEDEIPSDVYFQCLDGSYNSNGNGVWGELTDGLDRIDPEETLIVLPPEVDLLADVYIGRAPAEDADEMANWVGKVLTYADSSESDYVRNVLLVGEELDSTTYGREYMEEIHYGSSANGYSTEGFDSADFFNVDTLYDADMLPNQWTAADMSDAINSNTYGIINHLGHCNYDYCARLYNADADQLENTSPIFAYSQGCIPGDFERDCIAEHFLTSTSNGMFSVVFNSRNGWYSPGNTDGPSQRFNRYFWHGGFSVGHSSLGALTAYSHEACLPLAVSQAGAYRWVYFCSNLLGDPGLWLHGVGTPPRLEFDRLAYRSDAKVEMFVYDRAVAWSQNTVVVDLTAGFETISTNYAATNTVAIPDAVPVTNGVVTEDSYLLTNGVQIIGGEAYTNGVVVSNGIVITNGVFTTNTIPYVEVIVIVSGPDFPDGFVLTNFNIQYLTMFNPLWSTEEQLDRVVLRDEFTNRVQLTTGMSSSAYDVVHGDLLQCAYTSAVGRVLEIEAPIDDLPPVITNVHVIEETADGALIGWLTDESSDSFVYASTSLPMVGVTPVGSSVYVDETDENTNYIHEVLLTGLDRYTPYYVAVQSADYAGNTSTSPPSLGSVNPDDYLYLITKGRFAAYGNDMEGGVKGWVATSVYGQVCWEYGAPAYGPDGAHSGEKCWGTVLDDRYPHLENAWVESDEFTVRENAEMTLWTWYSIVDTPGPGYHDAGFIEVNDGTGWYNVSPAGKIQGSTGDWIPLTVDLSDFSNATLRVRFRIDSDDALHTAGWYVDDVEITDMKGAGVTLTYFKIDDTSGGDGDCQPEPNETFSLKLTVFNSDSNSIYTGVTAEVSCPQPDVDLVGGPIVDVSYGTMGPRTFATYAGQVVITNDAPTGTVVRVFHDATAVNSDIWRDIIEFEIVDRETVSGVVTDLFTGAGIAEVTVSAVSTAAPDFETETDGAGEYALYECATGTLYQVSACKPDEYSPSDPVLTTAPTAVDIGLGRAYAGPDPTNAYIFVEQTQSSNSILTLVNTNGNIAFNGSFSVDYFGNASNWLSVTPPTIVVAAGTSSNVVLNVDGTNLHCTSSKTRTRTVEAILHIDGNDISCDTVDVPVTLDIWSMPALDFISASVVGGDGDEHIEPGETAQLGIVLRNTAVTSNATATGVSGTLVSSTNAAIVTSSAVTWGTIPFASDGYSVIHPSVSIPAWVEEGALLPFVLTVNDGDGREWIFEFTLTAVHRHSISGVVTNGTGTGVSDVLVRARGSEDEYVYEGISTPGGSYVVEGIRTGDYEVVAVPPPPYGMPVPSNVAVYGNVTGVDFLVEEWGITAAPSELVVSVDEGREYVTNITIGNSGTRDGYIEIDLKLKSGVSDGDIGDPEPSAVDWGSLTEDDYAPGQLLVRFKDGVSSSKQATTLTTCGTLAGSRFACLPGMVALFSGERSIQEVAEQLEADPNVEYVEPNYRLELYLTPNDPMYSELYGLHNEAQTGGTLDADINAPEAWDVTVGETGVVVAVVDTGVEVNHEDLADNVVEGYHCVYMTNAMWDANGHGTHVAGTIGAVGNNSKGISGVSWHSKLMPLNIFDDLGNLYMSAALMAIEIAVSNDVPISNHSWGGSTWSGLLYEMCRHAWTNGHIMVCAAGNNGGDNDLYPNYPASYNLPNIVSVAATDHAGLMAYFSCYGAESVDICAPGVEILSTVPDFVTPGSGGGGALAYDNYAKYSGTSMAAPHVAGMLALLKSIAPWATLEMVIDAVLNGSRYDPLLEGVVSSSGHLNAEGAIDILKTAWIDIDPWDGIVPAGGTLPVQVSLNAGGHLLAGNYEAEIQIKQGLNSTNIPVTLTVNPAPVPIFVSATAEGGDGDGYAEPGETVDLKTRIRNEGSFFLANPTGFLSTAAANVTVLDGVTAWASIGTGDESDATDDCQVQFGNPVTNSVPFTLVVGNASYGPWTLTFSLPVTERLSITGRVYDTSAIGVSGAVVECWGGAGGGATTDANGYYGIHGLPTSGVFKVRAIPLAHEKSAPYTNTLAGADGEANFEVRQVDAGLSTSLISVSVQQWMTATNEFHITNASTDGFDFECMEFPHRLVTLISDDQQLANMEPIIRSMGFEVVTYTSNYEIAVTTNAFGNWCHVPNVLYTDDDAVLFKSDIVVADISGIGSHGRALLATEKDVFERYLARGRKLILTAANPLSQPDNWLLTNTVGVSTTLRSEEYADSAGMSNDLVREDYVDIDVGDAVSVTEARYDLAALGLPETNATTEVFFVADDAVKILRRQTDAGGVVYYWAGNGDAEEWESRGVWQDTLKNILFEELQADVTWLTLSNSAGTVSTGTSTVSMTFSDAAGVEEWGTNRAAVVVMGNYPGAEESYIPVSFEVLPPAVRAISSTGVSNWMGEFLWGDGSETATMFQVIWAGPDQTIDPPRADGSTSDDDRVLAVYPTGKEYGRFGRGYEAFPQLGRFDDEFLHNTHPTNPAQVVYVRAWDAATPADSVAYGDSGVYVLTHESHESHDFGSWIVNRVLGYPGGGGDYNGDSILDGWYVEFGMDARRPIVSLTSTGFHAHAFGSQGGGVNQFEAPTRMFLAGDHSYVLDTGNNRIQVWDKTQTTNFVSYAPSNAFSQPYGLCKDPRTNRFAVADTGNDMIRVFSFDPDATNITEEFAFGSHGAANGQFDDPSGVAIDEHFGRIYVADTENNRVQIFDETGAFMTNFGVFGEAQGEMDSPKGIYVDENLLIWVADTDNDRIQVFNSAPSFLWEFGDTGAGVGEFSGPTDVQKGVFDRIFVADRSNCRIQVFRRNGSAFDHLLSFGSIGDGNGQLLYPFGVTPAPTSGVVYVVDTGNDRIQRFNTVIDADADGMDDAWEENNGLDSSVNDALNDDDGDGIYNIGEYRLQTNPQEVNTDGDEWSDGQEISRGSDPLDPLYDLLRMTSILPPADVILGFMAEAGKIYEIEFVTNLISGTWAPEPGSLVTAVVNGIMSFTNTVSPGESTKFYRAVEKE